jgi:hypothetical protein
MEGISINGKKLHEIMMPLVPYENCNSIASLRYPKQRIKFEFHDDLLKLTVPSKLALEMYRVGILPQDETLDFPVSVSGESIGNYKVVKFLYPNSIAHDDIVFITLHQQ